MSGGDVGGLSRAPSKTQDALQLIWDSWLPQVVQSITLWLKRCTKAGGKQFEHTKWLSYIRRSVHCVVSVTLFCCVLAQTFFSTRKSLSGHTKISITLLYLKIV